MRWSLAFRHLPLAGLAVLAVMTPAIGASAQGQDAGAPAIAASLGAPPATTVAADPRVAQLRALIDEALDVTVSPQSLVDVPLSDEAAIQVEATRLRALLRSVDEAMSPAALAPATDAGATATTPADGGTPRGDLEGMDRDLWDRRLELDRARLELSALGPERRAELLRAHTARQEAARPRESDAERRAREAEAEHQRALAAASAARTEAERLVSEELARLIALEASVATVRSGFQAARDEVALRRDVVLGWQRRVRGATASGDAADATYDALGRALSSARDDLSAALGALSATSSAIPTLGKDALVEAPPDVAIEHVRERRALVERAMAEARRDERELREERAAMLLDELSALNHERLELLPHLSSAKRAAITGFTPAGWAQARSEARQLSQVLRYHVHIARAWVASLRTSGASGISPWTAATLAVPLLILTIAFVWGRRRTQALLELVEARVGATDRTERRLTPSVGRRVVQVLAKTHRSLEWIAFVSAAMWLLPSGAHELLEVRLVAAAIGWILAGALVVDLIDALAAGRASALAPPGGDTTGRLRLRSLRLVGRTVVAFTLIQVLSAQLVERGTIYGWVSSIAWFTAIPVFLLLVRWWRGTVFERMDRGRKKTPLQAWVLANRSGWKSFLAAMIGALQLFGGGVYKTVRGWLSEFDVARRAHAYLFKRELDRIGEGQAHAELAPLDAAALEHLHPEQPFTRWIACPSDEVIEAIDRRIAERQGGLVAVVGARGMGKSSLFRALAEQGREVVAVACTSKTTLSDLRSASQAQDAAPSGAPRVVLLDNAHALIRPRIGGLALFDDAIALARAQGGGPAWVFAFDAAVWPLLRRARDSRPLFDEVHALAPWTETQIGALLDDRCERAQISPTYEDLLEKLPPGSDELDRQDALRAKRAGYERMLWDHVNGNPALALEAWRASLARDASGVVRVRSLRVPDMSTLERLPDSSLFILRTVLQLAPASIEAVAEATCSRPEEVLRDLRFGQAQGFFSEQDGQVRVAWPWLRAVTQLLHRRHLLELP